MKTKYFILLGLIGVAILYFHNHSDYYFDKSEKQVTYDIKNNKTKKTNRIDIAIEGVWYGDGMTRKIVVTKLSDKSYQFHSYYKDGSDKKEKATLNSSGEYHTYNRFKEYYKVVHGKLGVYDNQGLIEFYTK